MCHRIFCSLLAGLLCVSLGSAELVSERKVEENQPVPAFAIRSYVDTFKANKEATVFVSGAGKSCLGLYVFDAHGNCVANDDFTSPRSSDDMIAKWIPVATTQYDVQIRNVGFEMNVFKIAIR